MKEAVIKIKICGLTQARDVEFAAKNGANFLGFVFCKNSPRNIEINTGIKELLKWGENIPKVAVISNISSEDILRILEYDFDYIQFHDDVELYNSITQLNGVKIIKSISENHQENIERYKNFADLFLFDAQKTNDYNGIRFNWEILNTLNIKKDWFLAGGLNSSNIIEALNITQAKMIDISSGIESSRGIKSHDLMYEFINKVKNYEK